MPNGQENEGINILGQKFDYPKAVYGTVAVCMGWISIALIICFSVYNFAHASKEQLDAMRVFWMPVEVSSNDIQVTQKDTMRVEFWTPSSKTKSDPETNKNLSDEVLEKDKWEVLADEKKVFEFGKTLKKDYRVKGYRRNEVLGYGRTSLKAGWWWVVSVEKSYPIDDFVKVYRDFWKSPDTIYIEVTSVNTDFKPKQ